MKQPMGGERADMARKRDGRRERVDLPTGGWLGPWIESGVGQDEVQNM